MDNAVVLWRPQPNNVYCMDALMLCDALEPQSVDLLFADLPYGITQARWDICIPFEPMWKAFKRVMKPRGAMVFTANQPFTSMLVMSNLEMFRQEIIWDKVISTGFLDANRRHMAQHENVLLFSSGQGVFNPQMSKGEPYIKKRINDRTKPEVYGGFQSIDGVSNGARYPKSIIEFSNADRNKNTHPTQKPVALLDYLIRTYTRPGDLVLDPVCGSGTTGVAARQIGRNFIMGDITSEYVNIARKRLAQPYTLPMFLEATS